MVRFFGIISFCIFSSVIIAQNDGIRGYGHFEFLELDTYEGKSYTNGGGGLIINNNLIFGVYVSALTRPFRWDLFTELGRPDSNVERRPLTNNQSATNSTITNFDVGTRLGFNIAPAKSLQATISLKIGYSTINYLESYLDEDVEVNDITMETLPIKTLNLVHNNMNVSPQIDFQFKVGKAFKISLITGYKIQSTRITAEDVFPNIDNLLMESGIFGGTYGGLGFTFGNL